MLFSICELMISYRAYMMTRVFDKGISPSTIPYAHIYQINKET